MLAAAMTSDPTQRFSNRVENYVKARPGYPSRLLDFMRDDLKLRPDHVIADIGSGTGILTHMLLENGNTVFAVEPNAAMRAAAEQILSGYQKFHSIDGSAESTKLRLGSVDFITAAQAFHWFHPERAREEFRRVLKPRGYVVLLWNDRRMDRPAFSVEYERILQKFNTDMDRVHHRNVTQNQAVTLDRFFDDAGYLQRSFDNHQELDWEGVKARVLSSSYMPAADDPRAVQMLEQLKRAFEQHQSQGIVRLEYDTQVFHGRLK